jgi:predicted enzyme related to lactoylglutathione lyase
MRVAKTYFMLPVEDMSRAIAFYRTAFDLELLYETPDWSEFSCAEAVSVALHSGMEGGVDSGLGFQVDDLEEACRMVESAGGRVVHPPHDRPGEPIRLAVVTDTESNRINVAEPLG